MFSSFRRFMSHPTNCQCQTCLDRYNLNNNKTYPNIQPIETNNKFKIVVVLDESGSMENIRQNMLDSLNDLIREQKQVKERPATFTLIKFNDRVNTQRENVPLEDVELLKVSDYCPNGSTALYDAIGYTINRFRNERDVLLVIITDGHENASRDFDKTYVTSKLQEKEKYNKWSYVYLSCDLNTFQQGNNMGFASSPVCSNVQVSKDNYKSYISKNLNEALTNYRTSGLSVQSQLNSN
jgi:predicted metal-dependent peptidase